MHLRVLGVVAADLDFLVVDRVRGQDIADAFGGNHGDKAVGIGRVQDVAVDVQNPDAGAEVPPVAEHVGIVRGHHAGPATFRQAVDIGDVAQVHDSIEGAGDQSAAVQVGGSFSAWHSAFL